MTKSSPLRDAIRSLRAANPDATASEMASILGVTRARIGQLLQSMGMPTTTAASPLGGTTTGPNARRQVGRAELGPAYSVTLHRFTPPPRRQHLSRLSQSSISVCEAMADLLRRGFEVFWPVTPDTACDLLALRDGHAIRVDVKTGTRRIQGGVNAHVPRPALSDCVAVVVEHEVFWYPAPPDPADYAPVDPIPYPTALDE